MKEEVKKLKEQIEEHQKELDKIIYKYRGELKVHDHAIFQLRREIDTYKDDDGWGSGEALLGTPKESNKILKISSQKRTIWLEGMRLWRTLLDRIKSYLGLNGPDA